MLDFIPFMPFVFVFRPKLYLEVSLFISAFLLINNSNLLVFGSISSNFLIGLSRLIVFAKAWTKVTLEKSRELYNININLFATIQIVTLPRRKHKKKVEFLELSSSILIKLTPYASFKVLTQVHRTVKRRCLLLLQ